MTNGYVCNGIMMIARSEQTRNFIPHFRRYSPSFGFVPSTIRTPFWDCILFTALKKKKNWSIRMWNQSKKYQYTMIIMCVWDTIDNNSKKKICY